MHWGPYLSNHSQVHRLAWSPYTRGASGQLSACPSADWIQNTWHKIYKAYFDSIILLNKNIKQYAKWKTLTIALKVWLHVLVLIIFYLFCFFQEQTLIFYRFSISLYSIFNCSPVYVYLILSLFLYFSTKLLLSVFRSSKFCKKG